MTFSKFLRDESGQVSVDWTVLVAALMGTAIVVVAGVWSGADKISDGYEDFDAPTGIMTMFVNGDRSASASGTDDTGTGDTGGESGNPGNPGNDKDVGKAGENPNGKGGWGSGDRGKSR